MREKFTQKDYFLYLRYYNKVLKLLKKELDTIKKSGRKTLWFYSARKTLEHLMEEKGNSLTPYDIDNIVYTLLNQIKEKRSRQ